MNAIARQLLHPMLHAQYSEQSGKKSLTDAQKNDPRLRMLVDRELEKLVQYVLRRHGYPAYELRDGLQEVRLRALEWFVHHDPPGDLEGMKGLCASIAKRYAIDCLRRKEGREARGHVGLCDDADEHELPRPSGQQRDPVDAGRQLEVAAALFREGKMPEHGVDILEGVACQCTHEEIGADLGISDRTVEGRLKTMRRVFKRKNRTRTRNSLSEIRDSCGSMSEGGRIEVREKRPSRPEIDGKS
jgi:RNA polymerase sigma factor (sigma-70 family)